ncbi:MAG TPA: heme lyase CcmF/NrfE family subunit [Anaerolineae bacterium]|nr:heme lyase CcmF/NrfE family subunit [Anaerolineae bacterium]
MAAEIGQFALIVALFISLIQSAIPLLGAHRGDRSLMALASYTSVGTFVFVAGAFAALTYCFVTSDFSVGLVVTSSQLTKPLLYKVTGVWANHEGSMLLWVLILAIFGAAIATFGGNLPRRLKARTLAVQGMIASGFLLFVLLTSNPFARLDMPPPDGNGMNPILQDPGLAFHPPFLYLGYVGFSVAFAFAVAALIEGRVDAAWARFVRPWVLAAWCFLTIGITLGSFWAYYVLGWGGWWFWDPVENVSFMPWLAGTALLHSALVVERRHALVNWTLLLAILTFSLSLIGTFVVRSGVLTSVHAFAQDPERGVFILALLIAATGGALTLYAFRIPHLKFGAPFAPVSRETSLTLNNVLLVAAAATVFLGTFYPLFIDLMSRDKISVGPPFYNRTFVPIMIPLLITLVLGPTLKWKRDQLRPQFGKLRIALAAAALTFVGVAVWTTGSHVVTALGLGLAIWIIVGSLLMIVHRAKLGKTSAASSWSLARHAPRAFYGMVIAHLGLGLVVAAITTVMTWQKENILTMKPGETTDIAGYTVLLRQVNRAPGSNYDAERGIFDISRNGNAVTTVSAERRFYQVQQRQTTETGISTNLIWNIYVALGEPDDQGRWVVRLYYHPLAPWLWLGGLTMALGGFLSLSDRRFRVGAPQRAQAILATAPAE